MTNVLMPALSPTMEEGVLAKWNIKAGDTVKAGDVIAEIETDKATMEVEAVDEGVVEQILVPAGTEGVKVNTPIARLRGEGEAAAEPPQSLRDSSPKGGAADKTDVASSSPSGGPRVRPEAAQRTGDADGGGQPAPTPKVNGAAPGDRVFATPLARRIAQQRGVDLKAVMGSGPHGRIVKADVENAGPGPAAPVQGAAPSEVEPRKVQSLEQLGIPASSYDLVPLDGMRRTIARRLTDSFRDVPHFPLTIDLEIDRLLEARTRINAALEPRGVKVSVNDLVIKAAAMALKAVPAANASYTPDGFALHHNADIAVAVALEHGLITPIVRKAETKSLAEIALEMKDLAARARERKLKPEEFQGGTFSVSNLGMFGIKSFASIINEPQGAILSVGAGEKRPVVQGDSLAIATVMSVTLTCDHRVIDGAVGSRFLQVFRGFIEDPITMLA
jgi:pyruvate dehydrogenase E2 component (dihydrolipoamide acetyltransferase)